MVGGVGAWWVGWEHGGWGGCSAWGWCWGVGVVHWGGVGGWGCGGCMYLF